MPSTEMYLLATCKNGYTHIRVYTYMYITHTHTHTHIYIYIYTYYTQVSNYILGVHENKFLHSLACTDQCLHLCVDSLSAESLMKNDCLDLWCSMQTIVASYIISFTTSCD